MAKLYNLSRMTTVTTGTGTITLGSAVTGFLSFSGAGVADGDVIDYAINDPGTAPTASEIGTGTYTASGATLTRTVTKSTNSNTAINLSGNAHVFISPRAESLGYAGQIPGTTTNDNASAGNVGEYFASNCPSQSASVTISIAAPCIITYTGHGLSNTNGNNDIAPFSLSTTGALPTGLLAATTYWAVPIDANTFHVATSIANALAGTFVTTTGTQSGTQTCTFGHLTTTTTATDITAISLTAGDWDVWGQVSTAPAGTTTTSSVVGWVSATSATIPTPPNQGGVIDIAVSGGASVGFWLPTGMRRISLASTTTVYVSIYTVFAVSTMASYGFIGARRAR